MSDCTHCGKRDYYFWKDSFKHKHLCSNCSNSVRPLGPIYFGPLHNSRVVDKLQEYMTTFPKQHLLDRRARLERLVPLFKEDLKVSVPWFYEVGSISKKFKYSIPSPSLLHDKLIEKGFQASYTHFDGQSIRTDYPLELGVEKIFD